MPRSSHSTATTSPTSAPRAATRTSARHAPVEISLQRPLLAGQRHRLDRRNHPHGTYQNYSLSISGRSKRAATTPRCYNDSQGIIDNSGLQRITGV
ncbi:MAG: hypothetical protein ACLRMJ_03740 [Alistipes finegoldii]